MKKEYITCEVVQDLLPLYVDECCSEQSKKIVEEHLADCMDCRERSRQFREKLPRTGTLEEPDANAIRRGVRKMNRWKVIGKASLCLTIAVFFILLPSWNYVRGSGLTYDNLKAAHTAHAFTNALISRNYNKAYQYLAIRHHYEDLLATDLEDAKKRGDKNAFAEEEGIREIEENGFDWYNAEARKKFMRNMETLEELNEMLNSCSAFRIVRENWGWMAYFDAQTTSGQDFTLQMYIYPDGIGPIIPSTNYYSKDFITGEVTIDEELEQKERMLSRFYNSPTTNETVMELLYGNTDWDWTVMFAY